MFTRALFIRRDRRRVAATAIVLFVSSLAPAAFAQTAPATGSPGQQSAQAPVTRTELDRTLARFATKAEVDALRAQLETLRARLNELKAQVAGVKARLDGGEASVGTERRPAARDPKI